MKKKNVYLRNMLRSLRFALVNYLLFINLGIIHAQLNVDSIKNVLVNTDNDSIQIEALVDLARYYARIDTQAAYNYLDQLLIKAEESKSEFAYLNAYNRLGNMAQDKGDYPLSIHHYKQGILTTTDSINIARLYGGIGASQYYMNQFDSAEYYMFLGYDLKSRHDPEDTASLATSLVNMSLMAERRNDFEKVLSYLHEAKDLFESIDNQRSLAVVYINLSGAYNKLDDQVNRARYLELAYNTSKALPDYRAIGNSAINYGHYYWDQEAYTQSLKYYQEAVDATRQIGQRYDLANALQNLGENHLKLGSISEARKAIQESLALSDSLDATEFSINNLLTLAKIEIQGNRPTQAREFVDQAVNKVSTLDYWQVKESTYQKAMNLYQEMGQYQQSVKLFQPYQEAKDSLIAGRQNKIVKDLQLKYQTQEKDALLAQNKLEFQKRTNQRNLLFIFLGSLLSVLFLVINRARINRRLHLSKIALHKEKISNLEKQQKLLAMDFMLRGQEEERKRIAQDLHDGLGGILTSARQQLRNIEKEIEKLHEMKLFSQAESLIDNACKEVRRIAHDMMPSSLVDLGLIATIEDVATKIENQTDILVTLNLPSEEPSLTDIQMVNIYRIIQEAVNNTIKYAQAGTIQIKLENGEESTFLTIADNGIGFDQSDPNHQAGLGLKNIESRVKYMNGQLRLESGSKGTSYYIQF